MPRIVDHTQRREEILSRCFTLFAERGYAALSMRGIASALGVTTGSLYYYFDSKQAIFEALCQHIAARDVALATAGLSPEGGRAARVAALERFVIGNADNLQRTLQLCLEYQRVQPDSRAFLEATLALYRHALCELLGLTEPRQARVVLSVVLGGLLQRILQPEQVDLAAHIEAADRLTR